MQVPRHDFRIVEEDGDELVKINVELPGVSTVQDITVRIEPPHIVEVRAPSYRLLLQLAVAIAPNADSVKFKKKTGKLTMYCRVITAEEAAAAAQAAAAAEAAAEAERQQQEAATLALLQLEQQRQHAALAEQQRQHQQQQEAAAAAAAEEERQRQQAQEERAAKAAAARAKRQRQAEQRRQAEQQRQAELKAAAEAAAAEKQRQAELKAAAEAAAAAAAAAADKQRQAQEQRRQAELKAAAATAEKQRQAAKDRMQKEREDAAAAAETEAAAAAEVQRQQQAERQRLQQQHEEAAAAAAAAAEKQRQWQAEQRWLQQQQAAAEAATKRALREQRAREEREAANKAAAEDWLNRGHAALSKGDMDLATRALSEATDLDPSNTKALQQLSKRLDALTHQTSDSSSSSSEPARGPGPAESSSSRRDSAGEQDQAADSAAVQPLHPKYGDRRFWHEAMRQDLLDDYGRKHSWSLVGCWCALLDAVVAAILRVFYALDDVLAGVPEDKIWFGLFGVLLWQIMTVAVMLPALPVTMVIPVWRRAWCWPLIPITFFNLCCGWPIDEAKSWANSIRQWLIDTDDLAPSLMKLALASLSGTAVYGVFWLTCQVPLGSHSLGGWLLVVVLLAWQLVVLLWRVLVWVWDLVLWDPPAWYPLQMAFAGLMTLFCVNDDAMQVTACSMAVFPMQIVITSGRWAMLCSFVLGYLWLKYGTPWTPEAAVSSKAALDASSAAAAPSATQTPATPATVQSSTAAGEADDQQQTLNIWSWSGAVMGMSPSIIRTWLIALSSWSVTQQLLVAAGTTLAAAVVQVVQAVGSILSTASSLQNSLAETFLWSRLGGLDSLAAPVSLLAAPLRWLVRSAVQAAAKAAMGVLTWALPLSAVEQLVQQCCGALGQWQGSCQQLLGPHAAKAPDRLALAHDWWFTVVLQLWLGYLLWRITYWEAHKDEHQRRQQVQGEKLQKLEAVRQKKEMKVQQRRQMKKKGR